jgi:hypothetical protein
MIVSWRKSPTSPIRPHSNTCQTYGQAGIRRPSAGPAVRRLRIGPSRYLDLTRLRLLGNRDAQGEYALIVGGRDPVGIQAFAEEQVAPPRCGRRPARALQVAPSSRVTLAAVRFEDLLERVEVRCDRGLYSRSGQRRDEPQRARGLEGHGVREDSGVSHGL